MHAEEYVIGAIKSPQFLELSGVGNGTQLSSLNISTVVELPYVGSNLQDHAIGTTDFRVTPDTITLDRIRFNQTYVAEQQQLL